MLYYILWKWFSKQIYWYDFHIFKLNDLKLFIIYIPIWPKPSTKRLLLPNWRSKFLGWFINIFYIWDLQGRYYLAGTR
jgi:hypothetical protein